MSSGVIDPEDHTRSKSSARSNMMSNDRRVAPLFVPRIEFATSRSRSMAASRSESHVHQLDPEYVLPFVPATHLGDMPDTPVIYGTKRHRAHRKWIGDIAVVELTGEASVSRQRPVSCSRLVGSRLCRSDRVNQDTELMAMRFDDGFVGPHDAVA